MRTLSSATVGARYSGVQYRTLNNADVNGFTYQGVSKFFRADVRVVWKINKTVSAAQLSGKFPGGFLAIESPLLATDF